MRNRLEAQLENLNNEMISMGALCEKAIDFAIKGLINNDIPYAHEAIAVEKEIDRKERDIENMCLKLLLQQQPVAKDLRLISSALKMITDMERIGDQAQDIAEIVTFADLSKNRNNAHILEMSNAVIKMVTDSIDAFVKRDMELAEAVIAYDDIVDELFTKIKKDIVVSISQDILTGESAMDTLMITKYLERIGDHAVNIAEWVEFSITGIHKKAIN